ncbi:MULTISPECIES: hypothetical protein [unclassified Caballeronia]|uniref:hypothetical protein n=1 Tax=unclassified Caballeronia TaxID=2646786 RepID=UPI0028629D3D|nr:MULTISPECIES: hypothetical protein [unclassified Caballeronia]MDR5776972.1 hypothetical protein [Caballeronia sp. LZ002]MDR5852453.1 hypothetical protein [Caballeronia sp. LZ003]
MNAPAAQLGFDFSSDVSHSFALTFGAWHDPEMNAQDWTSSLHVAARGVANVDSRLLPFFQLGIDTAKDELAEVIARHGNVSVRMGKTKVVAEDFGNQDAFFELCEQLTNSPVPGIEVKSRDTRQSKMSAVFVEGVGTLIARYWSISENGHIAYVPWKDRIFLSSYLDDMPVINAPYATWKDAYCADKIAMSGKGVASVPTFKLGGREYVRTCGTGFRGMEYGRAWRVVPIADWTGETYSYQTITKTWDDGIRERGDDRGLVVKVRGQLCVLESAIEVYDERPSATDSIARLLADRANEVEDDEYCDDEVDDDTDDSDEEDTLEAHYA